MRKLGTLTRLATMAATVLIMLTGCSSLTHHHRLIWLCGTIEGKPLIVVIDDDQLYIKTKAAIGLDLHVCSKAERKVKIRD